jgi:hypothetical protein
MKRMFAFLLLIALGGIPTAGALEVELSWDDGIADASTMRLPGTNENVVKFTPPAYPCTLKTLRYYIYPQGDTTKSFLTILLHQDAQGQPGSAWDTLTANPTQSGWHDVDYAGESLIITDADSSFFAGIHWTGAGVNFSPYVGIDNTNPDNMSWQGNDLSGWSQLSTDVMIRAVVLVPAPADTTPPTIEMVQQPADPTYYTGDPYTVSARVTDSESGVDSVVLFYKAHNETIPQPWGEVAMTAVSGDTYSAAIPDTLLPAPLYRGRYYVWARDTSGNEASTANFGFAIELAEPESLRQGDFSPGPDSCSVAWNAPSRGANWSAYRIYRSLSAPNNFVLYDSVPPETLHYTDRGFQHLDYYYVTAVYPIGESAPSDTVGIFFDAVTEGEGEQQEGVLGSPSLSQNVPNPVSSATVIEFVVPNPRSGDKIRPVQLAIFNVLGQTIRTLKNGKTSAGVHHVVWDGRDDEGRRVSQGLYFYQVTVGTPDDPNYFVARKRMLVVK